MRGGIRDKRTGASWCIALCCKCARVAALQVMVSQHAACPFGAVASVHAWERVGAAVTHVARKFLKIAMLRYVDDLFAPERWANMCGVMCIAVRHVSVGGRRETMEHALQCLARLIRVLLGPTAVANKKLACGVSLDVLGVRRWFSTCCARLLRCSGRWISRCPRGAASASPRRARSENG